MLRNEFKNARKSKDSNFTLEFIEFIDQIIIAPNFDLSEVRFYMLQKSSTFSGILYHPESISLVYTI